MVLKGDMRMLDYSSYCLGVGPVFRRHRVIQDFQYQLFLFTSRRSYLMTLSAESKSGLRCDEAQPERSPKTLTASMARWDHALISHQGDPFINMLGRGVLKVP